MLAHGTASVNSSAPPAYLDTEDGSPDVTCVEARPRPGDRLCLSAVRDVIRATRMTHSRKLPE
jgi:hypothetical protein